VPFEPHHAAQLAGRIPQRHLPVLDEGWAQSMAVSDAWACMDGERVVAIGGVLTQWHGHHQVWSVVANDIGVRGLRFFTSATLRLLRFYRGRIESVVEADFLQGHKFMRLLGFDRETPGVMRHWFPDGADAVLYARIN
jgi:hypothetical protein